MIVIGTSLGGMKALRWILTALPSSFSLPIVATLHRHKESDETLVELLQVDTKLPVSEVVDKEPIRSGHVYVAPADYHLFIEREYFSLSTDELVQYARPSIDVVFESAADTFGKSVIGIVLTGANHDGSKGAKRIKDCGGMIIVQDPKSAECSIMPASVLQSVKVDYVRPVDEIGQLLLELTAKRTFAP